MQELMKKLNIAKGTIYHYFSSKESLLESVVEDIIDKALQKKQLLKSLHHPGNTLIHTRQLGSYLIKLAPIFAAVIEEGCDQGLFKTEHPRECAEFMLAGFQFLTDLGFYPWSQAQLARRMKSFPSLIEAQLSAPKGSFNFLTE